MKKVVIALDEGLLNDAVCEYGLNIAKEKKLEAVFVYTITNEQISPNLFTLAVGGVSMYDNDVSLMENENKPTKDELDKAHKILKNAENLANKYKIKVQTKLEYGNLIDILLDFDNEAEIFVMSIKDNDDDSNKNANSLLKELKSPILFVNKKFSPIKSVLVAFDGLEASIKLLKHLKDSEIFGKDLFYHIININSSLEKSNQILEVAKEILKDKKAKFIAQNGEVSDEIVKYRRANQISLFATGTLSKNAFFTFILGSISQDIMDNALVPVFVMA